MSKEFGSFAKEMALQLDINVNTLRRWALELEKCGYEFTRNEKDQRIFYERDNVVLSDFKRTIEKTQSLENTAKAVAKRVRDKDNVEKMLSVLDEKEDKISFTKDELQDFLKQVIEDTVAKTATEIGKKMDDRLEKRDRQLVQQLNESMEKRRLEIAVSQEQEPVSWWSRLFGKKEKIKGRV